MASEDAALREARAAVAGAMMHSMVDLYESAGKPTAEAVATKLAERTAEVMTQLELASRRSERAKIVTWLRETARQDIADAIENGAGQ